MRYLNTWTSPIVFRAGDAAENIGVYGVEGSKPGAAAVSAFLSHDVIGLHSAGYGLLLSQALFSCNRVSAHSLQVYLICWFARTILTVMELDLDCVKVDTRAGGLGKVDEHKDHETMQTAKTRYVSLTHLRSVEYGLILCSANMLDIALQLLGHDDKKFGHGSCRGTSHFATS
jgi:hypothetical protein